MVDEHFDTKLIEINRSDFILQSFVHYTFEVYGGIASSPAVAADLMPNMTEDIVAVSALP